MANGRKTGGRQLGTPNKATEEKKRLAAEIAERTMLDARAKGKQLGKEVLADFMELFTNIARYYQPKALGGKEKHRRRSELKFLQYANLAIDCANKVANYQSAKFGALPVSASPPTPPQPEPAPAPTGKTAEVIDMKTDVRVSHLSYMRMIGHGK